MTGILLADRAEAPLDRGQQERERLKKEADESCSSVDMRNVSKMVTDILEGFNGISDEKLATMKWLSPVLSTCIQTNNTSLRTSVQILLTRLTQQMSQSES